MKGSRILKRLPVITLVCIIIIETISSLLQEAKQTTQEQERNSTKVRALSRFATRQATFGKILQTRKLITQQRQSGIVIRIHAESLMQWNRNVIAMATHNSQCL